MTDVQALEREALATAQIEMGRVRLGTVALAIGVVIALTALTWAAMTSALPYWLTLPLLSWVYYASYTPLHETVHRNVSGGRRHWRWLDDVVGTVCGTILGISYTLHRAEHLTHHRETNHPERDPDHVFGTGLLGLALGTLRIVPAQYLWYFREVWPRLSLGDRIRVTAETGLIVATRLVPALLGFGDEVLWYSVLPNVLGVVITATLFAWIVHAPGEDTSRWGATAVFDFRGAAKWPVTTFWLWQNYHAIHHLFPRVPFYRYHAVFDGIESTLDVMGAPVHRFGRRTAPSPAHASHDDRSAQA